MDPYNSLTDPHLSGYFCNDHRKRQIIKAGLISKQGELISESTYKLNSIIADKKYKRDDKNRRYKILPRVNIPSEDFCKHQPPKFMSAGGNNRQPTHLRSSFDRIKSAPDYFKLKPYSSPFLPPHPFSHSLPLTSPLRSRPPGSFSWKNNSNNEVIKLQVSADKHKYSGFVTCKTLPLIKGGQDVGRELKLSGTLQLLPSNHPHINDKLSSPCMVTMRYHGDSLKLLDRWCVRRDEVAVEQQLNGGGGLIIFREMLSHGSNFTVESRRQSGQAFSLTLYVNRTQNTRISVCCEAKHKKGFKLGGSGGQFSLIQVNNSAYCQSCSEKKNQKKKNKKKNKQNREKLKGDKNKRSTTDDDDEEDDDNDDDSDDNRSNSKIKKNYDDEEDAVDTAVNHDNDRARRTKKNKKTDEDDYSSDYERDLNTNVAKEKTKHKKRNEKKINKNKNRKNSKMNSLRHVNVLGNVNVLNGVEESGTRSMKGNTRISFEDTNETARKINGVDKSGGSDGSGGDDGDYDGNNSNGNNDDNDDVNNRDNGDYNDNKSENEDGKRSDDQDMKNDDDDRHSENDKYKNDNDTDKSGRNKDDEDYRNDNYNRDNDNKHDNDNRTNYDEDNINHNKSDHDDDKYGGNDKNNGVYNDDYNENDKDDKDDYDRNIQDMTETLISSVYRRIEGEVRDGGRYGGEDGEDGEDGRNWMRDSDSDDY